MSKIKFIIMLILFILINIASLYVYDKYYHKSNALSILNNIPIMMTGQRENDNENLQDQRHTAVTEAVRLIEPAVVSVNVIRTTTAFVRQPLSYFFHQHIPVRQDVQSVGSGVLFTDDGYIITNAHVVENATQITVVLTNTTEHDATVIGIDNIHDIAVLKIDVKNLPYAKLGTSADLLIGEWSIAIGNPFAFLMGDSKPSVSVGVISAVNRNINSVRDSKIYKGMIQTDAAINPGNSGGPLVNIYGEVIGINSFIFTDNQGSIGIGFAIPIDRVRLIAEELILYGRMREPYYGLKVQDLTVPIAHQLGLRSLDGVIVSVVEEFSPAEISGLKRGDIITKINDITVRNSSDAVLGLTDVTPGNEAHITVLRSGREYSLKIVAGEYH